jgi:predicted transcriptional regulator
LKELSLGNYRDKLDIIADILNVTSKEVKKTQIMYQANLSYRVLQKYLSEILDASLVRFDGSSQSYILTSKGQDYLFAYKEYSRTNKSIEKRLNDFSVKRKTLEFLCAGQETISQPH